MRFLEDWEAGKTADFDNWLEVTIDSGSRRTWRVVKGRELGILKVLCSADGFCNVFCFFFGIYAEAFCCNGLAGRFFESDADDADSSVSESRTGSGAREVV